LKVNFSMSYMRGDHYLWRDDAGRLHVWVADGYDGWDEAIWAVDEEGKRHDGHLNASGVSISEKVMDEFVVMRVAEMVREGSVDEAIDRAVTDYGGNFGCQALAQSAERLKAVLRQVRFEEPNV
jgi:hypothetical protein